MSDISDKTDFSKSLKALEEADICYLCICDCALRTLLPPSNNTAL